MTTISGIQAVVSALAALHKGPITVRSLQEIQGQRAGAASAATPAS